MAKVVKIKPVSEGTVRVELGISMEDLRIAREFDPRSLEVVSKETKEVLYLLALGTTPGYGKETLVVPTSITEGNIDFLLHNVKDDVSTNAALANIVQYGSVLAGQIKKAVEAYSKAKEKITIEGEGK